MIRTKMNNIKTKRMAMSNSKPMANNEPVNNPATPKLIRLKLRRITSSSYSRAIRSTKARTQASKITRSSKE